MVLTSVHGQRAVKKVAAVARLKKRDLKKPDKVQRTFDRKPISLDGRLDLDITFDRRMMTSPIYLKMVEGLLLSEGVCRQLEIISYHPEVTDKKEWIVKEDNESVVPPT